MFFFGCEELNALWPVKKCIIRCSPTFSSTFDIADVDVLDESLCGLFYVLTEGGKVPEENYLRRTTHEGLSPETHLIFLPFDRYFCRYSIRSCCLLIEWSKEMDFSIISYKIRSSYEPPPPCGIGAD